MAKYFGIYASENERNAAVTSSAITRPYVALVDGQVDYDSYWDGRYYVMIEGQDDKYYLGTCDNGEMGLTTCVSLRSAESGETGSGIYYGVNLSDGDTFSLYKSNGKLVKNVVLFVDWMAECGEDMCEGSPIQNPITQVDMEYLHIYNYSYESGISDLSGADNWIVNIGEEADWAGAWHFQVIGEYSDCSMLPCGCNGDPACECENAGGTWVDDGEGGGYCDCNGDPVCECLASGGTWFEYGEGGGYCDYGADPGEE